MSKTLTPTEKARREIERRVKNLGRVNTNPNFNVPLQPRRDPNDRHFVTGAFGSK
jgi:hypothetical protein